MGLLAAVAAAGLFGGPVAAQTDQWNSLFDRIIRLEAEVRAMRGQPAGLQGNESYRLAAMEEQLRQLAGQMQQMQQQIARLEAALAAGQQPGSNKSGSLFQPQPQNQMVQQVIIPQQDESNLAQQGNDLPQYQSQELAQLSTDNSGSLQKGQAPQILGQLTVKDPATGEETGALGLLPETVETAALDGNQVTGAGSAEQVYQTAYESMLGRQFGQAEAGFRTFVGKYPTHPLAGNALYWLGETYFVQGDYKQAAQNFLQGYRTYPESKKAPDSLLKLGMSLAKLGQKPQACGAYAEVTRKYATVALVRNQALQEMKRAGC
jgi:tol-pal system protein YbgF